MAERSFAARQLGASLTVASDVTMLHLFTGHPSQIEVVDNNDDIPVAVRIKKESPSKNPHDSGLTVVWLDWDTAKQVTDAVMNRLESADHEALITPLFHQSITHQGADND